MEKVAKTDITRADIQVLVGQFYERARKHPRLGPIFHDRIGHEDRSWGVHIAKIEGFWANVMLKERTYHGNPMQVHQAIPDLSPGDFDLWLQLFHDTATDVLPPAKAASFSVLSRRIGRSLAMGLQRSCPDGVPDATL